MHQTNAVRGIFWAAIEGSIHSEDCTIGRSRGGRGGGACSGQYACRGTTVSRTFSVVAAASSTYK